MQSTSITDEIHTENVQSQSFRAQGVDPNNDSSTRNDVFVLKEKGHFAHEIRAVPSLPSERHVIVEIKATGLCGSDIHYWQHGEIGPYKVRQPLVLGHESAGIVWKCGSAVNSLTAGDAVAIEPGVPCQICSYCRDGRYNLCPEVVFAATPPHDGTLSTFYTVPEDFCYRLPTAITLEEGALLEPLSVAVHCAKLASISYGTSVLVLGAGPIGLLCCAVARAFGAIEVVVVDVVAQRLEFARDYAATGVYKMVDDTPEENAANLLRSSHLTEGFEVVIDATGAAPCISTGLYALKRGGTVIQAGLGAANINFPVGQLCSKEAKYFGSFRYGPGDYETALRLLEQGTVQVKKLITHRFPFSDAQAAFENVANRQGIKTVIQGPTHGQNKASDSSASHDLHL